MPGKKLLWFLESRSRCGLSHLGHCPIIGAGRPLSSNKLQGGNRLTGMLFLIDTIYNLDIKQLFHDNRQLMSETHVWVGNVCPHSGFTVGYLKWRGTGWLLDCMGWAPSWIWFTGIISMIEAVIGGNSMFLFIMFIDVQWFVEAMSMWRLRDV